MKSEDVVALIDHLKREAMVATVAPVVGIIGHTPAALDILSAIGSAGLLQTVAGVYARDGRGKVGSIEVRTLEQLTSDAPSVVIVASDEQKEALLREALPYIAVQTRVLIGGYSHFGFRDPVFTEELRNSLIPSLANGYPNSLIHIYQCLQNASRLQAKGIVAEFGMFKGGTTMLMSRFIERLGQAWKVYGFDSFAGFPPRRSPLDMYAHADCVFLDEPLVRRMFEGRNVEIIAGDIVETVVRIKNEPVILAFIDTDNFTSASAVLDVVQDQVVLGGAIVFDHFAGRDRFLYTLGERMAAERLLDDVRYFNLHDTGVFLRQR